MIQHSLRMTQCDWRAGELRLLFVASIVAVRALSSVGFFADRIRAGLARDAHQLLGADLPIAADQPVNPNWRSEAQRRGLTIADTVVFPIMALAGEGDDARSQLASLKAVSSGYRLHGNIYIGDKPESKGIFTRTIPAIGTVWVDQNILKTLNLQIGALLKLGDRGFTIAHILSAEPDRGSGFVNFSPSVMLSLADLASTNLVQDGSRVTYRLLLAGAVPQVHGFQDLVEIEIVRDNVKEGVRIESLEKGCSEMRARLDRGQQFLLLVNLLSAMLEAVAIAMV
ncbi:MAG: ABC transporter permease, partial [Glaciimonas sp.]|nr:ABC transporter permease [Glaciimonas sp.]